MPGEVGSPFYAAMFTTQPARLTHRTIAKCSSLCDLTDQLQVASWLVTDYMSLYVTIQIQLLTWCFFPVWSCWLVENLFTNTHGSSIAPHTPPRSSSTSSGQHCAAHGRISHEAIPQNRRFQSHVLHLQQTTTDSIKLTHWAWACEEGKLQGPKIDERQQRQQTQQKNAVLTFWTASLLNHLHIVEHVWIVSNRSLIC